MVGYFTAKKTAIGENLLIVDRFSFCFLKVFLKKF